jgi:predicted ATPase
MRFTHVTLRNWRNFKEVDVPLGRRVFLFGPNAAGKSNLLDAFRFLRDVAEDEGGLKRAVDGARRGMRSIRSLHATRTTDVVIEVRVALDPDQPEWLYSLGLHNDEQGRVLVKSEVVERGGVRLLERPDADDQRDPKRLAQTHLEQVSANQSFRELAESFASIQYIHIVPQIVRGADWTVPLSKDPFGSDFLQQLARTTQKKRDAKLRRIEKALQPALPRFEELQFDQDELGRPHLKARYKHWRGKGAWQLEDQFSDGTLRLVGLLWALLEGSAPLLLEEPELSLHAAVVRQIPRMMATVARKHDRQIFISTHSEQIMAEGGIDPSEILILEPTEHETRVWVAQEDPEIQAVAAAGGSIAELLVARTRPRDVQQLAYWGA